MSTYVQKLYPDHYTTMNQGLKVLSQHSYIQDSTWLFEAIKETKWTTEENKLFESALALFDKDTPDRWYNVAAMIPGKTVNDVIKQYRELEDDVSDIEAGLVPVPGYGSDCVAVEWTNNQRVDEGMNLFYIPGGKRNSFTRPNEHERKKGVPWTEEEHRQFLLGLKKYGKGDWRNISRNFVTSRTPTQVASHAQKYFIRQVSGGKDKRRSSIHDITTVNLFDAKSTSPDDIKPPTPDNCLANLQQPQQRPNMIGMCTTLYDWNVPNQGSVMAFNMPNSSQLMAPLSGASTYGLEMQDKYMHKAYFMDLFIVQFLRCNLYDADDFFLKNVETRAKL